MNKEFSSTHRMNWPYFILVKGRLIDESNHPCFRNAPHFKSVQEAENWLIDQNERGTVVSDSVLKKMAADGKAAAAAGIKLRTALLNL
jgi:hypothetical protein